jgi:hypothetical protein
VDGPSAWYASDYKNNEDWVYTLTPEDVEEIEAAVARVIQSGADVKVRGARVQGVVMVARSCGAPSAWWEGAVEHRVHGGIGLPV